MSDSNVIFNDFKLCFTERIRTLTRIGGYYSSKVNNDRSWMSENSFPKSNFSPSFNEFRTASSEKLLSNVCLRPDGFSQEDFSAKVHTSSFSREYTEKKLAAKPGNRNYLKKSFKLDGNELKKIEDVFEVVGKGTTLMNIMNFPTVIVKHITGSFEKSRVYHVILQVRTEAFTGSIPALLFSSPYAHRRTRFGELLPLGFMKNTNSVYLTPLLLRKRFKRVFRKGCSLKIKVFVPGRVLDDLGYSWNRYDLSRPAMQNLLKEFIELDIRRMFSFIFHKFLPAKHRIRNSKLMQRNKTSLQRKLHQKWVVNLEDEKTPPESFDRTNPQFRINSKRLKQDEKGKSKELFSILCLSTTL